MPDQTDLRAPVDEQPIALSLAEEAGTLPDIDRRADDTAEGGFDIVAHLANGFRFSKAGAEWTGVTPEGETGHGVSPEDALLNIGAQVLPDPVTGKRSLHRRDGTVILLDTAEVE